MDTTARRVVEALVDARLLDPALRGPALDVTSRALGPAAPATPAAPGLPPAAVPPPPPARGGVPQVVEVVAYLGTALVLAAGSLLALDTWSSLGLGGQVALLAVVTLVLGGAGAGVALTGRGTARRGPRHEARHDARRRLAGALLAGAALAAGGLVAVVLERGLEVSYGDGPGGVDLVALATWLVVLVVAVVGYRLAPTALGLVVTLGSAVAVVSSLLSGLDGPTGAVVLGLALVGLGLVTLVLAERRVVHEVALARVLGALLVLAGAQWPVLEDGARALGYLLTAAAAVAGAAAYVRLGAWPYLAVAVLAVTVVVPEAVSDWTGGGLGVIGAVLLTGITLLLASGAATVVRSRRGRPDGSA